MSSLWREHYSRVLTVWGCWCGVCESKLLVCVQTCVCFSVLICTGVCFSCGPSNGHKAGSVCPLGCWNVHFGQQAASVLNRSCLSYCTSRTMSFSFSLYLSFSLCLSLFMTIYRQCFQPETGEDKLWLVADVTVAASLRLTHGQTRTETWASLLFATPLFWSRRALSRHQGTDASHCRRGTVGAGTPRRSACTHACLWIVCVSEEKWGGCDESGLWVFPSVTWSTKNKTTWCPQDSTSIEEVPPNSPKGTERYR